MLSFTLLFSLCLFLINIEAQSSCTITTTDCRACDDHLAFCTVNANCRPLLGSNISPLLRDDGITQICVNLASCDSDCTLCPDTTADCTEGSAANCIISGDDGSCVGNACGLDCNACGTRPECILATTEPNRCIWSESNGDCSAPPTENPTAEPSPQPTRYPTSPTLPPTRYPTPEPSPQPTRYPTPEPSPHPTVSPTSPTLPPTRYPTPEPTPSPTRYPTPEPTPNPTPQPTTPTLPPTRYPTPEPTPNPTVSPTEPTAAPIRGSWSDSGENVAASHSEFVRWMAAKSESEQHEGKGLDLKMEHTLKGKSSSYSDVVWSIGRTALMNLWAMLIVFVVGNALICWCVYRRRRDRDGAHLSSMTTDL